MATPNPPPSYSASEKTLPDNPPPAYVFPETFKIGTSTIKEPVVRVPQLKGHLALLKAFVDLRVQIGDLDAATVRNLPHIPTDKERRWTWFVGLAVERFERWCLALTPGSAEESPKVSRVPLDVIMVFHSYLLNPLWFWEDCSRVPKLAGLGYHAELLGRALETPEILTTPPASSEIRRWVRMTSTPFDYLESAAVLQTRTVDCPKCSGKVEAALMTADGTGYLQEKFVATCPHCSFSSITKESLAVRRLCGDLISKGVLSLPGTLYTPAGVDSDRGRLIKGLIMLSPKFQRPNGKDSMALSDSQWLLHMTAEVNYSLSRLRDMMASNMRAKSGNLLGRILRAYSDDKLFSVDLRGAVLRQGSFITKMHDLGWTEPQFFGHKEDEVALQHAIARYHAFLDLMTSSPASFFVPTLDIDLAWHTHQLTAEHYKTACMDYVGRFIDHDDKVEAGQLSSAFDITCRAWKNRFNVEYTHCGCPLPGQTIGQKLSRLVNRYTVNASYLTPPARDNLLAATHPSDHNAVFATHQKGSISGQEQQRKKIERRRAREARDVLLGKADPKRAERGAGHDPAFLVPVPIFFAYGAIPIVPGCTAPASAGNVGAGACSSDGVSSWGNGGGGGCGGGGGSGCGGGGGGCGGGGGGCGGG
ncbi:hypothetical protein BD779DRAFT_1611906 [Infundibulicybe gibba]|nr:hypothetical protein BD779DRAFT_1611906 [Infundibulicybe gibba]